MKQRTNKTLSILLSFVMLMTSFFAFAVPAEAKTYTKTINNVKYTYEIINGKAIIDDIVQTKKFKAKTVKIPSKLSGKTVTKIMGMNCKNVNIVIPDTVQYIINWTPGGAVFEQLNLSKIGTIKFGKNLKEIPDSEFMDWNCNKFVVNKKNKHFAAVNGVLYNKKKTKLLVYPSRKSQKTFTVPKTVKTIDFYAFKDAKLKVLNTNKVVTICDSAFSGAKIDTLNIGSYVKSAFYNTIDELYYLTAINVSRNNKYYSSDNGVLFNKNRTTLIVYPCAKKGDSYTIPYGVRKLGYYAFNCKYLKEVSIPETVTAIDSMYSESNLRIKAPSGSYAEKYANENDIDFQAL